MSSTITSGSWWSAASIRALRTALVIAVPYVPASATGTIPWLAIASAVVLGFILSMLTSLAGLAETDGTVHPWWYAVLVRVVKSIAQALVAGIGTAVFVQDLNWTLLLQAAVTAGFGSLLLAVISDLPEAETPKVAVKSPSSVYNITTIPDASTPPALDTSAPVTPIPDPPVTPVSATSVASASPVVLPDAPLIPDDTPPIQGAHVLDSPVDAPGSATVI